MNAENLDNLVSDFARFYILTILYEGPTHGYGILSKFQNRVGKKISPGLIYPFLQKLEDRGLITYASEMVGEKERKMYFLTETSSGITMVAAMPSLAAAHATPWAWLPADAAMTPRFFSSGLKAQSRL